MSARIARLVTGVVALLLALAPAAWANTPPSEYQLKAAFLYKVTHFVDWPPESYTSADSAFRICVFGTDPFGTHLDALSQRQVGTRRIEITHPSALAELPRCQIAYLARGTPRAIEAAATGGAAPGTLTVSSEAAFAREGGMVALVLDGGRVRLHVNLASIRRSPLRVSAKLLELSEVRHGGGGR